MYPVSPCSRSSLTSAVSVCFARSSTPRVGASPPRSISGGASPGGTSRSTTLSKVAPRRPGLATATFTLHAPRSTAKTRDDISVFPREDPRAFRHALPDVLRHHLGVPHAVDRGPDRRKHRRAVLVQLLACDLAVRLDAIRAPRPRDRDLLELRDVELEPDLLAGLQARQPGGERLARRAAGHRAALPREQRDRGARILDEVRPVLGLGEHLAELA